MKTITSSVTALLEQNNIAYDLITIPLDDDNKPIRNLEALLESEGQDPNSVIRSILFRTGSDTFVLLAVAGGGRADWGTLRKHLGERKLTMADYDQIEPNTGYVMGAVPPIALPDELTILIDGSINDFDTVIIGSGVLGYALALSCKDLASLFAPHAQYGQFTKSA